MLLSSGENCPTYSLVGITRSNKVKMFQDSQALKYQNQMVIRKDILNSGKEKVVTVINLQEVGLSGKDLQKKM